MLLEKRELYIVWTTWNTEIKSSGRIESLNVLKWVVHIEPGAGIA
jgi:hypothetical protein